MTETKEKDFSKINNISENSKAIHSFFNIQKFSKTFFKWYLSCIYVIPKYPFCSYVVTILLILPELSTVDKLMFDWLLTLDMLRPSFKLPIKGPTVDKLESLLSALDACLCLK